MGCTPLHTCTVSRETDSFDWTLFPLTLSSRTDSPWGIFLPSFEYDIFSPRQFSNYHNHFNQCIHTYVYTCTYIQPYMNTYIHNIRAYIHAYKLYLYICACIMYVCTYVRICILYTSLHAHMHTYAYIIYIQQIYIYIHTYIYNTYVIAYYFRLLSYSSIRSF